MIDLRLGDCLAVLKEIPDNSVDLVLTDPPYYRVKAEAWDRQWNTRDGFLEWLDTVVEQLARVMKPNASLYLFASPQMAAHVEVMISRRLNVLNNLVWAKPSPYRESNYAASNAGRICKEALRCYYPNTERIIFAEHYGADNMAKGEVGYVAKCDELRGFVFEPLRGYLAGERDRAGRTTQDIDAIWQRQRNSKGCMAGHWFGVSQWALPTEENYNWLRGVLGSDYLKREYDELKREYDELKSEYESLRRPFSVSPFVEFTDVWDFPTIKSNQGTHPCEKPQPLLHHAISASSVDGATVLDCFMGTGSIGIACKELGRKFIGIEREPEYYEIAKARIESAQNELKQLEIAI